MNIFLEKINIVEEKTINHQEIAQIATSAFFTHSEETGRIPDNYFYISFRNYRNRWQRVFKPSVKKPAQFQSAVSICQFVYPGTTL